MRTRTLTCSVLLHGQNANFGLANIFWSIGLLIVTAQSSVAQGTNHELACTAGKVQLGRYDAAVKPVLTIKSGDTVRAESCFSPIEDPLVSPSEIPTNWRPAIESITDKSGPGVHLLTGPILVEGAEPGDVLEVHFQKFELRVPFGVVAIMPTFAALPEDFPYEHFRVVRIDQQAKTAQFSPSIILKLAPFFGSVGVAPPFSMGRISSIPPGLHGGNLDNRELTEGSTLFLPVHVDGALLSIGDAHAVQGDGEVSCCALETALIGTMRITVHKGRRLLRPRAETPTHFISMGLSQDLDKAAEIATRDMVDLLVNEKKLSREDALMLCSVALELRVTQLVDGTKGIHGMLPKSIFK